MEWFSSLAFRERHAHIKLYSDSSSYAWGGVWSPGAIEANIYDYWDIPTLEDDIATKETLALNNVLLASGDVIRDSWVDAFVDCQTLIHFWNRQGSRSHSLIAALKTLFGTIMNLNIDLHLFYVTSSEIPAPRTQWMRTLVVLTSRIPSSRQHSGRLPKICMAAPNVIPLTSWHVLSTPKQT